MRKFFTIGLFALTASFALAQGSSDSDGKVRFGLKVTPSVNWYKPDGKFISGNGAVPKFGGGLVLEFRLAKIISLQSGLQVDFSGGKVKYGNGATPVSPNSNSVSYYYNNLDETIVKYDSSLYKSSSHTHYQLNDRSYTVSYVTIPLTLKMKTKEIGSMTYYGQFGVNNSIRWKATATDDVQAITATGLGAHETKQKIDVTKDVNIYSASLNIGLGAELNLSGSTSLTFGLNYLSGFTNFVKDDSKYLERRANDGTGKGAFSGQPQKLNSNSIVLLIGVLF
jgi:hypothetical protein